ncbi:MAG: ATP-dependent metallopeptidase FtsH/Yme1/Tma family protein [Candidatus Eisenbacteria bacterium]|uniref:ATP-dependent zinc metalloprotease FtsH n=1 Tax=Eiseniibacteriota bacterium TaxID=2212470 RepID=A0A7Y2E8Q3_UNCEI|nr:ATP-dependent metallopeptidase FtsH/Yme1/Tma family protein [Candidatus Eisenbacteria bacterium]
MAPRPLKTLAFWLMMTVLVLLAVNVYQLSRPEERKLEFSQFYAEVLEGNIEEVAIGNLEARGELRQPILVANGNRNESVKRFIVNLPGESNDLWKEIREKNPEAVIDGAPRRTNWFHLMLSYLPILLIIGFWLFFIRQMQSGGSSAMRFGKSKAKLMVENKPKVTFRDVAGADEAKEELQEIIEFLKDPKKFQTLGGRIPKGALLLGPPGTGKTLLAKAVAGEAGVPFFSMSGSDFVEMFVGVGASRVRDLFEQGKRNAPCIMFIDEIDAVGRHRGAGLGGGHDEREQTLNQLLVEMDGFESNEGVILIAATNRPDVLDPALLRPGRFDRQIVVDAPDVKGREGILRVHTRKIPLAADVDLQVLARGTPGMVGADIANMVNEAALLAARHGHRRVTMRDFEDAKDKVMMGAERKSRVINEEEKKITAYHEAGHTIVGWLTPGSDPIHKVTIIPRGRALGVTHFLPMDERYTYSREYCIGVLARMMGGRAAEQVIFNEITTGAGNDIEQATGLARKMVCQWGMSEELGPLSYGKEEGSVFLGREIGHTKEYSDETHQKIDSEIRKLVEDSNTTAFNLLRENEDKLHSIAKALLEREILDSKEIDKLMNGEELDPFPPTDFDDDDLPDPSPTGGGEPVPPMSSPDLNPGPA